MVSAAGIGLDRSANVGHQIHVRYDGGNRELDEITVQVEPSRSDWNINAEIHT